MNDEQTTRAARLAETIANDFYDTNLDLSKRGIEQSDTWREMPAVTCVTELRGLGASERQVRQFLTFISAMNRARPANALWRDGLTMFRRQPELFDPVHIASMSIDTLREVLKGFGVSRRHGPDSRAWSAIAASLASGEGPVARAVADGVGDAAELLRDLRSKRHGGSRYPMLRGPKIGPMWVRIMMNPGGAKISRIDAIDVAVDVHVKRVTENLGVTNTGELSVAKAKPIIHAAWQDAVAEADFRGPPGIEGTCAALDPALWFFGMHGCKFCEDEGQKLPISRACDGCILFAPTS